MKWSLKAVGEEEGRERQQARHCGQDRMFVALSALSDMQDQLPCLLLQNLGMINNFIGLCVSLLTFKGLDFSLCKMSMVYNVISESPKLQALKF